MKCQDFSLRKKKKKIKMSAAVVIGALARISEDKEEKITSQNSSWCSNINSAMENYLESRTL